MRFENIAFIKATENFPVDSVVAGLDTLDWQTPDRSRPIGRTTDIYWMRVRLYNPTERYTGLVARFHQHRAYRVDAWIVRDRSTPHTLIFLDKIGLLPKLWNLVCRSYNATHNMFRGIQGWSPRANPSV